MRSTRVVLLFFVIAIAGSCGAIPPYSSVNKQAVRGFYTLKLKTVALSSTSMTEATLSTDSFEDTAVFDTSATAIELEKVLRDQLSAVFSIHKREYTLNGNGDSTINGNQIHAGLRRYFGDRALTAFIAAEGIYSFNVNHTGLDLDLASGPGWAIGGGANFALSESLSIEASVFHESMWPAASYASGNTSLSSDYEHSFKSTIGYIGIGFHF